MELFDLVNNLYNKRSRYPTEQELSGKMYIVNKFVAMNNDLVEYIAYVSKYLFTLGNRYYRLLYRLIPQSFVPRVKYIKPKKTLDDELLNRYSRFFGVSKRETVDYIKILTTDYEWMDIYEFVGLEYKEGVV